SATGAPAALVSFWSDMRDSWMVFRWKGMRGEARQSNAGGLCEQSGRQSPVDEQRKRDRAHAEHGRRKSVIGASRFSGERLSLRQV
ncbi:hypothetical protein, partial [Paraburkholderia kirstenboschensis]|uniref:hypothetical protein n=1 Tax=Paraburkholderia kirstenboschensis TaxID=1245436 RepID=UPI001FB329FA